MKNKIIIILLALLVLSSLSFADHTPGHQEGISDAPAASDFEQNPTPENFMSLENPTAANLLRVNAPTVENFNFLSATEQGNYLAQQYNNEFAQSYYRDSSRVGVRPEVDDKYFSGDGQATQSRDNIRQNTPAAETYFTRNYGEYPDPDDPTKVLVTEYGFTALAGDFSFNLVSHTLINNGKTLPLQEIKGQPRIIGIQVIQDGFVIIEEDEQEMSVGGDGAGALGYDEGTLSFTDAGNTVNTFTRTDVDAQERVAIDVSREGTITVKGPAQGQAFVHGEKVQYTNRRGTLVLSSNGDIKADNAEVITHLFYVDGAFKYNAAAKQAQIQSHGSSTLGNVRALETVFIYRAGLLDKNPGAVSQGQAGDKAVTISLDTVPATSRFSPQQQPPSPQSVEESRQQLRERAQAIAPSFKNLGGNAEVTFGLNQQQELIVTAVGPVEVGFYHDNALLVNEPLFRGLRLQGQQHDAEFELKTNGDLEVDVRGIAKYADDQFGSVRYDDKQVRIKGGIEHRQEGASLALRRLGAGAGKDTDLMDFSCFQCAAGETTTISKSLAAGRQLQEGTNLFEQTQEISVPISVVVGQDGKITHAPSLSDLQSVARSLNGNTALLERYLDLSLSTRDSSGAIIGTERLRLSKPEERSGLVLYQERYDQAGKKIGSQNIDFGISDVIGNAIIVTSPENKENAAKLFELIGTKQYEQLSSLRFVPDRDLRQFIKRETRIDIALLDDPGYAAKIGEAARHQREFEQFQARLLELGIQMDENGVCRSPPNCAQRVQRATENADALAYVASAAKLKLLEARKSELDALAASDASEGKDTTPDERREITREIRKVRRLRENLDTVVEQKQAAQQRREVLDAIHQGKAPEGSAEFLSDAASVKEWKKETAQEIVRVDDELRELERQLASLPTRETLHRDTKFTDTHVNPVKALARLQQELPEKINSLLQKREELVYNLQMAAERSNDLVAEYIAERPDFAGKLAIESGEQEIARSIATSTLALVDSDAALRLEAESYLSEDNNPDRFVFAARSANAIQDGEVRRDTLRQWAREAYNLVVEKHPQNELGYRDVSRDVSEVTLGEGIMTALGLPGAVISQAAAAPFASDVDLPSPSDLQYLDTKQRNQIQRLNDARSYPMYTKEAIRQLGKALREDDLESFNAALERLSLEEGRHTDAALIRQLREDLKGDLGNPQRQEERASAALAEARRSALVRDTFITDREYKAIVASYAGTDAARQSQQRLDQEGYTEFLDHYAPEVIESMDVVVGATALKIATLAARIPVRLIASAGRVAPVLVRASPVVARTAEGLARIATHADEALTAPRYFTQRSRLTAALDNFAQQGGRIDFDDAGRVILEAPAGAEPAALRAADTANELLLGAREEDVSRAVLGLRERLARGAAATPRSEAAERVTQSLREQQVAGKADGALAPVTRDVARRSAVRAERLHPELNAAELRLLEAAPSSQEIRLAAGGDDPVLEVLLEARREVMREGRLDGLRQIDMRIAERLEQGGRLPDAFQETRLGRLTRAYRESGGNIADDADVLSMTTPASLDDLVEEAVSGKIAKERVERAATLPWSPAVSQEAAASGIPPGVIDFRRPQAFTSEQLGRLEGRVLQLADEEVTLGRNLGAGFFGTVYCIQPDCARVIKLPHALEPKYGGIERSLQELRTEVGANRRLEEAGIAFAKIHNPNPEATYLIKDFVDGPVAGDLIQAQGKLHPEQIDALVELRRRSLLHGIQLDTEHGGNLIWDARNKRFVVIDPAPSSVLRGDALWEKTFFLNDPEGYGRFLEKMDFPTLREETYLLETERYLAAADPAALAKFREERALGLRPRPEDILPQNILDDIEDRFNPVLRRVTRESDSAGRLVERVAKLDEDAYLSLTEIKVLEERVVEVPRVEIPSGIGREAEVAEEVVDLEEYRLAQAQGLDSELDDILRQQRVPETPCAMCGGAAFTGVGGAACCVAAAAPGSVPQVGELIEVRSLSGNNYAGRLASETDNLIVIEKADGTVQMLRKNKLDLTTFQRAPVAAPPVPSVEQIVELLPFNVKVGRRVEVVSRRGNSYKGIYEGIETIDGEHFVRLKTAEGNVERLRVSSLDLNTLARTPEPFTPFPVVREPYESIPHVEKTQRVEAGVLQFNVEGETYIYRPGSGYLEETPPGIISRIFGRGPVETPATLSTREAIALESSRLEVPPALVEESVVRRFSDAAVIHPQAGPVISPRDYERHIFELVDEVGDGSSLTRENIRELVLHRAQSEVAAGGMTADQFAHLFNNFDDFYDNTEKSADAVARFSAILAQQTPGYTNVHLFRDGSVLGASDELFQRVTTGRSDVRIIYASRDTSLSPDQLIKKHQRERLLEQGRYEEAVKIPVVQPAHEAQSGKIPLGKLAREAEVDGSGFLGFRQKYHRQFAERMQTDLEFRETATRTFFYLQEEGLIQEGAKLRFIDTCCTGTINYYLEGVVNYFRPDIRTESLLMESGIKWLDAGLNGIAVEQLNKPVRFSFYFDESGRPLMELVENGPLGGTEDQVLSFLDELVALQKASERARATPR